jgi:hypothetical protein
MSTDTNPRQAAASVLRAVEAPTETRLSEAHPPAYVDVSDGTAARKAIIPRHLRDGSGLSGLARGLSWWIGRGAGTLSIGG